MSALLNMVRSIVDNAIEEIRGQPGISCGGLGCNGCCRGEVGVHDQEFMALLPEISDGAWNRVLARADDLEANRRTAVCPLLDPETGGCEVYDHRPVVCRVYLVATPVDYCFPERAGVRDVGLVAEAMAYVMVGWRILSQTDDPDTVHAHTKRSLGVRLVEAARLRAAAIASFAEEAK